MFRVFSRACPKVMRTGPLTTVRTWRITASGGKPASFALTPKVSARIKAGQRRQEEAAVHTGLSLRQHVERELYALSTKADTDQARLRALELLGKTEKCGIFLERTADVADDRSPNEIQAELEARLRAAFEKPV